MNLPPDDRSVAVMEAVDALPRTWRPLVHEFGIGIVQAIRDDGATVKQARAILEDWRRKRQEQWLATDYITPRFGERMRQRLECR